MPRNALHHPNRCERLGWGLLDQADRTMLFATALHWRTLARWRQPSDSRKLRKLGRRVCRAHRRPQTARADDDDRHTAAASHATSGVSAPALRLLQFQACSVREWRIAVFAEPSSSPVARRRMLRVYDFTTWAKARAMQHWIDCSRIADRPMPAPTTALPLRVRMSISILFLKK